MTPAQYDAYCLYEDMKGLGTETEVLSEIIGSRTPHKLVDVKRVYAENYGEDLDNAITRETCGKHRKLLLCLLQCKRSQSLQPYPQGCKNDAASLYQAGEVEWGTEKLCLIEYFLLDLNLI